MTANSFLDKDGKLIATRQKWWQPWLPKRAQMERAAMLDYDATAVVLDGPQATPLITSMRQALGLVVVAALVGGLIPFIANWIIAARMGTVVPLAQFARSAAAQQAATSLQDFGPLLALWDSAQTVAGLPPAILPGWIAAFLSALGLWINWPLQWLTWWLVYGAAVLLTCKLWHVPTTLQQFYALTGYAALPLILVGLGPIPCLGQIAQFIGVVWMFAVYVAAVRAATGLDAGRATLAVVFPGALLGLVAVLILASSAASILRLIFA